MSFHQIGTVDEDGDSNRYRQELLDATHRLGLTRQVQWSGWQPSASALLDTVDAVVVPSQLEPFSMIALEAILSGVPVVAANEGGPTDLLEHGRSGWLYDGRSAQALADVLLTLLQTDALARVAIEPAALDRFTAPVVAARWLQVYERWVEEG